MITRYIAWSGVPQSTTRQLKILCSQSPSSKVAIGNRTSPNLGTASTTRLLSTGKKSTTSRDTRLAGRLRFYKKVGVEAVSAPWENLRETMKGTARNDDDRVESPISAGVDGTDSASGVHRPILTNMDKSTSLEYMLSPRRPGSTGPSDISEKDVSWYGVTLDGRILKTPMGQTLAVPSEMLAHMIAVEWDKQEKHLKPVDMPLMTLACTTLDQAAHHPHVYREEALRFLPTDTTCFWADPTEDRILHRRQEDAWKELHRFVQTRLEYAPAFAMGANEAILMARKRGDVKPRAGLPHPPKLLEKMSDWTQSLDAWHLVALSSMCAQAKSFLIAWASMEPDSPFGDIEKAMEASRVEEEFQISSWGLVEGGHDYDRLNCSIQMRSAQLFVKSIALDNELLK